jgi:ADP-L-glycero-D-manno-heptose 6-epimerase
MASAIVKMLPDVLQKGTISLFKSDQPDLFPDGEQKRDFVYVKDVARMTCAFLHNEATGIFNIGSGEAISWNRLARAVFAAVDKPAAIFYIDMPEALKGKYQNFTEADVSKAREALGTVADPTSLEIAVVDYVQHFLLQGSRW